MRVMASRFWRWPEARVVEREGRSLVVPGGPGKKVLPRGVELSSEYDDEPIQLPVTMHQISEKLHVIAALPPEDAAEALAAHCREWPAPTLCVHGLGRWHETSIVRGRFTIGCPTPSIGDNMPALDVGRVMTMISGLNGIESLAYHLVTQRKPASSRLIENALVWPLLGDSYIQGVRGQLDKAGGFLVVDRARDIVTNSIQTAFVHSDLRPIFTWEQRLGPDIVLRAGTDVAAYIADLARHIGSVANEDRSLTCVVCGQPYRPRRSTPSGSGYCKAPECQRERNRRNQVQSRAARAVRVD